MRRCVPVSSQSAAARLQRTLHAARCTPPGRQQQHLRAPTAAAAPCHHRRGKFSVPSVFSRPGWAPRAPGLGCLGIGGASLRGSGGCEHAIDACVRVRRRTAMIMGVRSRGVRRVYVHTYRQGRCFIDTYLPMYVFRNAFCLCPASAIAGLALALLLLPLQ